MRALTALAILVLALPLAGCTGPLPSCKKDGALDSFAPGDHDLKLCVGGKLREVMLVVPQGAQEQDLMPLLLMLHGGGGNGAQMRRDTGMDAVAAELGFVVAYPEGTPARRGSDVRTWNAMHCCGKAYAEHSSDVAFLAELVEAVRAAWPIDAGRVGVAGHSNGAMMAYRFAAERSDLVASVMPVAGAIGGEPDPGDAVRRIQAPELPVSALVLHARDDPRVPYEGGQGENLDGPRVDLSVAEAVAFWSEAIGAGELQSVERDDGVEQAQAYGDAHSEVRLLTTEGGHGWPGTNGTRMPNPSAPNASAEVGAFLVGHARRWEPGLPPASSAQGIQLQAEQGPHAPGLLPIATVHPIVAHLHTGLETFHANATVPTSGWNRAMLTLRSWPGLDEPWDRTFHVGIGDATVLHGTTPRTNFTTSRDITPYASLLANGTIDVWSRLESYVGQGIFMDVTLDFYDDVDGAAAADAVATVWTIADLNGAGTYAWANVSFAEQPPASARLEVFTSGHAAAGEFWWQDVGATAQGPPRFRLYVDDEPVAFFEALPYVYALVGVNQGSPGPNDAWWTAHAGLDAAGVHTGVGQIPPYVADLPPEALALLAGPRLVRIVQETHGGYWPVSVNLLVGA